MLINNLVYLQRIISLAGVYQISELAVIIKRSKQHNRVKYLLSRSKDTQDLQSLRTQARSEQTCEMFCDVITTFDFSLVNMRQTPRSPISLPSVINTFGFVLAP